MDCFSSTNEAVNVAALMLCQNNTSKLGLEIKLEDNNIIILHFGLNFWSSELRWNLGFLLRMAGLFQIISPDHAEQE